MIFYSLPMSMFIFQFSKCFLLACYNVHPIGEVVTLVICILLCGSDGISAMAAMAGQ